jgi:hypothetical protein
MSTNLQVKSVQFAGRTLFVSEATLRNNLEMLARSEDAESEVSGDSLISVIEGHFRVNIYPKLAAVTTAADGGPVPSVDEFLDAKDTDTNEWYLAAVALNPHWFPEAAPAEVEKKKRKRSRRDLQPVA